VVVVKVVVVVVDETVVVLVVTVEVEVEVQTRPHITGHDASANSLIELISDVQSFLRTRKPHTDNSVSPLHVCCGI
jgi:hypothetical protein